MQETFTQRPKSNIRIGLDPVDSQPTNYFSQASYFQSSKGNYASEALMSEKELAEELESSQHHQIHLSRPGTNGAMAGSWGRKDDNQTGLRSRAMATSVHSEYIPPPLPPASVIRPLSPRVSRSLSPYADDAMIVPATTTPPVQSQPQAKNGPSSQPAKRSTNGNISSTTKEADDPSSLHIGNSLTVQGGGLQQDRFSVSSFFSTLALDPEPQPAPDVPTSAALFSSEEFIIPAPVARKVPALAPTSTSSTVTTPKVTDAPPVSTGSTLSVGSSQVTRRELRQEEIKVATSFAHELGFEIINPSPATSPQMRNKSPTPSGTRSPRRS
ncbi:hypothetical protein EMPS_09231 [Entomortierella parvispora]|uniref:Uncharacterized protein n=1 Tax=Entomortierella parvispora TaxID=205924 RepID=A0A9P3HHT1_9FUNG|nr:hypothetical protein EMPS_09231 [Entomortierella parvispora]